MLSNERRLDIMAYGIVYCLIDITSDREYIGQTRCAVKKRFREHKRSKSYIGNAIRAIGAENFLIVILKECDSKEELDRWEKHFIKSRDTLAPNGYNLTEGGEGTVGFHRGKPTPEHCAKLSAVHAGKKKSPEHVAKVTLALKGRKQPPEFVEKHAVAIRKLSPYRTLQNEIEQRKLTYAGISRVLGLTNNVFSNKMRGRRNFTVKDIAKLVEIFGKPAEYLMTRCDGLPAITSKEEKNAKISAAYRQDTPFKNLIYKISEHNLSTDHLQNLLAYHFLRFL